MAKTTLEQVIKQDPTLDMFINNPNIDWFNDHHVNLRFASVRIALAYYIEKIVKEIERDVNSGRYLAVQYAGRMNRIVNKDLKPSGEFYVHIDLANDDNEK